MCGIIGIHGKNVSKINSRLFDAVSTLEKRGPDENGIVERKNCILAQTRLSILDIDGGKQPMKDTDSNVWISFNGEIYNFLEVKKGLEKRGHIFSTSSDTEVIIKAYKEYGEKCVEKIDGMFAFAIWDEEKDFFMIARDRLGKKPLYMMRDKENLYIASEIKALKKLADVNLSINKDVLDNFLQLMYVPPTKCIYNEITVLPPAHYIKIVDGKETKNKYWQLCDRKINIEYGEAKSLIKQKLENAVSKRMIADVEIGSLLSGGVDSTLISILASKHSNNKLKTFSIKYGNDIDETEFAKKVSEKIRSDHHVIDASKKDILKELYVIQKYLDEPHADSSLFPQHVISELAVQKLKVVLTGDGADEFFMGYGWYTKWNNLSKLEWLRTRFFSNRYKEHLKYISVFSDRERKKLWKKDNWGQVKKGFGSNIESGEMIKRINNFDINIYLPGQLLTKIDRTSMMHSLEARSPFLDTNFIEFVYNIPTEYKMKDNKNKIILKDILSEYMPNSFVYRKKQGFGAPVNIWLKKEEIKERVFKILDDKKITSFFEEKYLEKIINNFYSGDAKLQYKIWSLLNLSIWFEVHNNI